MTIGENSKAESITITANGKLTGDAANDKLYVADAITVSDSGEISISSGAVVRGYNGPTGKGLPSDGDTTGYTAALTMNGANTKLTLASGGALQMNSVALTGTTVSIDGAKSDRTSWNTEYAQLTGNSITLDNAKVTLGAKSLVQTKGVLNVNGADTVITMEGSGTESGGKESAAGGAIINGTADSHLNFNDGTINVATGKCGEIHSPDINLNGTDINVSGALTLSGQLRKNAAFGNLTADVDMNAGTITVAKGSTLTVNGTFDVQDDGSLINSGIVTLKENADLSDIHTLRNEGTINFNGDSLTLASHLFDALFATTGNDTGSLSLAENAVVRVVGDEQIDLSVASSTGAHNITAAGSNTLYVENAKLDTSWDNAHLALNVGTLDVSADLKFTEQSPKNNAFVITSGSITVSDAININVKDNATDTDGEGRIYVYAKDAGTNVNLDLVNDGAVTGQLNNLDRLFVGVGTSTSGTAALEVDGSWNFGDARIVAGQSGSVSLGGTVTNVDSLMLNGDGSVTVEEGANVTVQRLLGSEGGTGALTVNGNLAFTGDGLDDKEASSKKDEFVNDVNLLNTPVTVNAGGTLAFTTKDAWDDFLEVNESGGVTSFAVKSSGGKTSDFGGWASANVTVNGTLALELGNVNLGEKAKVDALKKALIGSGSGVLNIGSATYDLEVNEDGSVDYDKVAEGVSNSQTENAVVNVDSTKASSGVTGEFGSVSLAADAGSDLNVKQGSTLILNQASAGNFVNTADSEAADVTVKSGAAVVLNGSGTVGNIVKDSGASGTSAVLNANGGTQNVGAIELAKVTVQQGNYDVKSVSVENLTLTGADLDVVGTVTGGTVTGNDITATTGSTITSSSVDAGIITLGSASAKSTHDIVGSVITADNLTLQGDTDKKNTLNVNGGSVIDVTTFTGASGAQINVGSDDAEGSTGTIVADTLNLSGATLTIDPVYGADFAAGIFKEIGENNILDGDVKIGQNSVMAVGDFESRADLASLLAGNGLLSGGSLREETGALLVLDDQLTIASGYGIALDGTKVTASAPNTVTLNEGSAIVLTEGAFGGRDDATGELNGSNAILFGSNGSASGSGSVTANGGKVILAGQFHVSDFADGTVSLFDGQDYNGTSGSATVTGDLEVTSSNGLIAGNVGQDGTFDNVHVVKENIATSLRDASAPVRDLLVAAVDGSDIDDPTKVGAEFLTEVGLNTTGKEAEAAARMAVYGGAVQAALLAQQTSSDAVADRLGMASVNSSLVAADNAQGGALWLAPVYRNMDSDDFGAQGVDYGADIDLAGVALGADFTTDSGVRVGGYFNVGSGDADGQGVGSDVSNDFDYFGLGIYAGMTFGDLSVIADAGFTQVSSDLEQNTVTADKLTADTDTDVVSVGLKGEYKLSTAFVDVVPHLGVRYTRLDMDSYDVKSQYGVIASSSSDTMDVFSVPFGVSLSKDIAAGDWTVKPVFDLTLAANAADDEFDSDVTFTGMGTSTALSTEVLDDFTYGASLGVSAKYADSLSVGVNVGYTGSDNTDSFGVAGTLRYMF